MSKLGADAIATVGLTECLMTIVYAVAMGLTIGVGAVVARRTGAKDARRGARRRAGDADRHRRLDHRRPAGAIAGPRLLA